MEILQFYYIGHTNCFFTKVIQILIYYLVKSATNHILFCMSLLTFFSKICCSFRIFYYRKNYWLIEIKLNHQSAFAKNRLITDNILVAFESLNSMKNMSTGNTGYMAIKLDMSKTYDRVEWGYLENVMRKMGFGERWIGFIMVCVKTVTYSIMLNGEPQGLIHPTRGIRQRDPLSPFLFLLCTEGLHGLIQHAASEGEIRGFSLCWRGPALTHLLFADDSLLFCRERKKNVEKSLTFLRLMKENRGKRWTRKKLPYFSVNQPMKQPNKKSRLHWAYKKLHTLSNTLGYHLW